VHLAAALGRPFPQMCRRHEKHIQRQCQHAPTCFMITCWTVSVLHDRAVAERGTTGTRGCTRAGAGTLPVALGVRGRSPPCKHGGKCRVHICPLARLKGGPVPFILFSRFTGNSHAELWRPPRRHKGRKGGEGGALGLPGPLDGGLVDLGRMCSRWLDAGLSLLSLCAGDRVK
jgi:hypothetical protein